MIKFLIGIIVLYIIGKIILPGSNGILGLIGAFWLILALVGMAVFAWATIVNII